LIAPESGVTSISSGGVVLNAGGAGVSPAGTLGSSRRDGVAGPSSYADRYEYICGELFKPDEYRAAFQKGAARRPRPPV